MKIAVIIDIWDPIVGGSQTHVRELSGKLIEDHGCEIDIFTRALLDNGQVYGNEETDLDGRRRIIRVGPATKLCGIWGRITTLLTIALALRKRHKESNYDLIHAHSILGGLIGKIATIFVRIPIVFTVHGSPNMDRQTKTLFYYIEKFIHTKLRYNRVISVGKGFSSYPNVNRQIEIIPNGINIEDFKEGGEIARANYFKVLFVGRMDWTKGVETLIKAAVILKNDHQSLLNEKKVQFHLIGYGDGINRYRKMAGDYGLSDLLIFRGKISGKRLIDEYKSSHLFILPSLTEGDSIVIKEAWAAKLSVISTICNAPEYYISEGVDGFLVEKQNPQKMAEAIVHALNLVQKKLDVMGQKGYEKVCEKYRWDLVSHKVFELYTSLIKADS